MKNIDVNDLKDMNVNPTEAADVKGGPHFISWDSVRTHSRSEELTLNYTEVEWTY